MRFINIILTVKIKCRIYCRPVVVTCDCPPVQISAMKKLGAKLDPKDLDTKILANPDSNLNPGFPVHFVHDVAHCYKNIRNAWAHHTFLIDSEGRKISWALIEELVKLQERKGLNCANRLTSQHVNFKQQIMKVELATQVFSRSVAVSLKFCRTVLKDPIFADSEATEEFILMMNDVFDIFNTRNFCEQGFKAPLDERNKTSWYSRLETASRYIHELKNPMGSSMVAVDKRKTAFVGMIANIQALFSLFTFLVENGELNFLLTNKWSQDHLEHLFGLYRARFGYNNNPTPRQMGFMYRKVLFGVTGSIVYNSNSMLQDSSELVALIPGTQERSDYVLEHYDLHDIVDDLPSDLWTLDEYKTNVLEYILGFVVKSIVRKVECDICINSLSRIPDKAESASLTKMRDHGENSTKLCLTYPSKFVEELGKLAENIASQELLATQNYLGKGRFKLSYIFLFQVDCFIFP